MLTAFLIITSPVGSSANSVEGGDSTAAARVANLPAAVSASPERRRGAGGREVRLDTNGDSRVESYGGVYFGSAWESPPPAVQGRKIEPADYTITLGVRRVVRGKCD